MSAVIAVIDFETTGSTPAQGARATEVAIVKVQEGRLVDRFQSLMHTGVWVPPFIQQLTGISNAMLAEAPPAEDVMREAAEFVGDCPLVAHNASFDQQFWRTELTRLGLPSPHPFACTVMLSRRLYPEAPNHKLGTLAQWFDLPTNGRAHRALADAEVTAHLLVRILRDLERRHDCPAPDHLLLQALQKVPAAKVSAFLAAMARTE